MRQFFLNFNTLNCIFVQKEDTIKELQTTVCKAKDKLNELLQKEDSRHDSGLDLDLSSSDLHTSELYQTHPRQIVQNNITKNGVLNYSSNSKCHSKGQKGHEGGFPKWSWLRMRKQYLKPSPNRKGKYKSTHHRQKGSPRRNYCPKGSEYTGYPDYSPYLSGRIRDSISDIAHHMDLMDNLTNRLHSSITMDMVKYRHVTSGREPILPYGDYCYTGYQAAGSSPPFNYYPGSRVPYITGSIVDSYNMERDSDTVSYVSNHLSCTARSKDKINDVGNNNGGIMTSEELGTTAHSSDVKSSRDNLLPREQIYTLENDMYYPTTTSSSDVSSPSRQHRQSHKNGRRIRKHQGSRMKYKKHQKHKLYPHPELSPEQQSTFNISFV